MDDSRLLEKERELENLREQYDELVESSAEIEKELESALKSSEVKCNELSKKYSAIESRFLTLQESFESAMEENNTLCETNQYLKDKIASLEHIRRDLEMKNTEYLDKIRILEANELDLEHKLHKSQEDYCFLQNDLEDITSSSKENEMRLKAELTELQAEVARLEDLYCIPYQQAMEDGIVEDIHSNTNNSKVEIATVEVGVDTNDEDFPQGSSKMSQYPTNAELIDPLNSVDMIVDEIENLPETRQDTEEISSSSDETKIDEIQIQWEAEKAFLLEELRTRQERLEATEKALQDFQSREDEKNSAPISRPLLSREVSIDTDGIEEDRLHLLDSLETADCDFLRQELVKQMNKIDVMKRTNAKLLRNLLISKSNIQICCRIRPDIDVSMSKPMIDTTSMDTEDQKRKVIEAVDENELMFYDKRQYCWKSFTFDKVWNADTSQRDVFMDVEPLTLSVLDGYNVCIMAYGQTGSGKTYTMIGKSEHPQLAGLSYRIVQKLFASYKKPLNSSLLDDLEDKETHFSVKVSMIEIYNDHVIDLLKDPFEPTPLELRQNGEGNIVIPGLTSEPVESSQEVLEVFDRGSERRTTGATQMNETSSRSHLILIIEVTTDQTTGKLYLVDLAGSERLNKSGVTGVGLRETQHINKSLSALGDVLEALRDKKSKHIPYRNSSLTFLLQEALGGQARTMMIFNICADSIHDDETLCSLNLASRVSSIQLGRSKKNIQNKNWEESLRKLQRELRVHLQQKADMDRSIQQLKKELKFTTDKYQSLQTLVKERRYSLHDSQNSSQRNTNSSLSPIDREPDSVPSCSQYFQSHPQYSNSSLKKTSGAISSRRKSNIPTPNPKSLVALDQTASDPSGFENDEFRLSSDQDVTKDIDMESYPEYQHPLESPGFGVSTPQDMKDPQTLTWNEDLLVSSTIDSRTNDLITSPTKIVSPSKAVRYHVDTSGSNRSPQRSRSSRFSFPSSPYGTMMLTQEEVSVNNNSSPTSSRKKPTSSPESRQAWKAQVEKSIDDIAQCLNASSPANGVVNVFSPLLDSVSEEKGFLDQTSAVDGTSSSNMVDIRNPSCSKSYRDPNLISQEDLTYGEISNASNDVEVANHSISDNHSNFSDEFSEMASNLSICSPSDNNGFLPSTPSSSISPSMMSLNSPWLPQTPNDAYMDGSTRRLSRIPSFHPSPSVLSSSVSSALSSNTNSEDAKEYAEPLDNSSQSSSAAPATATSSSAPSMFSTSSWRTIGKRQHSQIPTPSRPSISPASTNNNSLSNSYASVAASPPSVSVSGTKLNGSSNGYDNKSLLNSVRSPPLKKTKIGSTPTMPFNNNSSSIETPERKQISKFLRYDESENRLTPQGRNVAGSNESTSVYHTVLSSYGGNNSTPSSRSKDALLRHQMRMQKKKS